MWKMNWLVMIIGHYKNTHTRHQQKKDKHTSCAVGGGGGASVAVVALQCCSVTEVLFFRQAKHGRRNALKLCTGLPNVISTLER